MSGCLPSCCGTTEGEIELKNELIKFEERQGVKLTKDNLLVVSASQQALDMIPKIFLDPGDYCIAGSPTYVGTIQAIQSYQGRVLGIPFSPENDGFDMVELDKRYARAIRDGKKVKYIYVIPDFLCNAGGVTCSYFEQVQGNMNFYWPREEVLNKLDAQMTKAFHAVAELAKSKNLYTRDAAYVISINRVASACRQRGWV